VCKTDASKSDPRLLSRLLDPSELGKRIWRASELEAILKHQLNASVGFDLGDMEAGRVRKLRTVHGAEGLLLQSFRDLLNHPCPPVELLMLTKDFAKRHLGHPESLLPPEIAKVLYLASIVVAMLRCHRRITRLKDAALREGLEWAMNQQWLDEPIRSLFREGLEAIEGTAGSAQ
jgi:hypothetical protein